MMAGAAESKDGQGGPKGRGQEQDSPPAAESHRHPNQFGPETDKAPRPDSEVKPDYEMQNLPPSRRGRNKFRTKMGGNFKGVPGDFPNQCEALNPRTGKRCRGRAMNAGKCVKHGGIIQVGPANGNFKHGRYSKYLPKQLAQRYKEAEEDPELLSARSETALLQVRIGTLLERLHTGESGSLWATLKERIAGLHHAFNEADPEGMERELVGLEQVVEAGVKDEEHWQELVGMIEAKTATAAREWKRLVDLRQVITAERAMVLFACVADTVVRHVKDQAAIEAISRELGGLITSVHAEPTGAMSPDHPEAGSRQAKRVVQSIPAGGLARPDAADPAGVGPTP